SDLTGGSSTNHAYRRDVAAGGDGKYGGGEIAHVRHPQFPVLDVQTEPRRVLHARFWPLDDSCGCDVPAIRCPKDQDRIIRVVRDKYLAAILVDRNVTRPVQLRPGSLDD